MRVRCFNICWDTSSDEDEGPPSTAEECELPTDCVFDTDFEPDDEDELEDWLRDELSDEYGFCHYGFDYEIVEDK
jgi:hypothetical protein